MANGIEIGMDFPGTCSKEYKYVRAENKNWVGGMYTGCYWLAYELTGNEFFREVAERHLPTYRTRIENKIGMDDHDVGRFGVAFPLGAGNTFAGFPSVW